MYNSAIQNKNKGFLSMFGETLGSLFISTVDVFGSFGWILKLSSRHQIRKKTSLRFFCPIYFLPDPTTFPHKAEISND